LDNGILILLVKNDRKMRIELGYGIESSITNADAAYLINEYLQPNFKSEAYAKGLDLATNEIIKYMAGQYKKDNPRIVQAEINKFWKASQKMGIVFLVLSYFFVLIFYGATYHIFGEWLLKSPFAYFLGCLPYLTVHGGMLYAYDIWRVWSNTQWVLGIDVVLGMITGFAYQKLINSKFGQNFVKSKSGLDSDSRNSSYHRSSSSSNSSSSGGGGSFGGSGSSGDW
jgi:uncharacterized protein